MADFVLVDHQNDVMQIPVSSPQDLKDTPNGYDDSTITEAEEIAAQVKNKDNSMARWEQAISYYSKSCTHLRINCTPGTVLMNAVIDISYSMDGTKLTAVKLGLCSIIANLREDDEMNIVAFSERYQPITEKFYKVGMLRCLLPKMLHALHTNGSTACYDATIQAMKELRTHWHSKNDVTKSLSELSDLSTIDKDNDQNKDEKKNDAHTSECGGHIDGNITPPPSKTSAAPLFKNITVVLTDGDDNESKHTAQNVYSSLCNPGINQFMLIFLAVDMQKRMEARFRNWMELCHCKQISVSVRSGSSLVDVFKEMLLSRILHTDITSNRFLQNGGDGSGLYFKKRKVKGKMCGVTFSSDEDDDYLVGNDYDDEEKDCVTHAILRKQLTSVTLSEHDNENNKTDYDNDYDYDENCRCCSPAVSVVESVSSGNGYDSNDDDDDSNAPINGYSPSSPAYSPSYPPMQRDNDDDDDDDYSPSSPAYSPSYPPMQRGNDDDDDDDDDDEG